MQSRRKPLESAVKVAVQACDVRDARLTDARELAGLMTELGYETSETQMIERLREILGRTDHRALVAAVDGTVVGMAGAFVGRRYESDAPYGHLLALVVSDAHRRAGIGRDLVVAAERWLASRGAGCIIVHSGSHRADAHAFYRSLGYEDTGFRFLKVLGARTDRT